MNKLTFRTILLVFLAIPLYSCAQDKSINFEEGRWAEILVKAKNSKKIIFLDAFASWCGPCKTMSKTVFVQDTVADFFNKNFINAKIDMEKEEGPALAKKYGVKAYPTYLFIDSDGNLVHRGCGSMSAANFIAVGRLALDPVKRFSSLQMRYDGGEFSPEFLIAYIETMSGGCMDIEPVLKKYFSNVPEKELSTKINWQMINRFVTDINSKEFNYLLNNRGAFGKVTTSDSIDNKIYNTFLRPAYKVAHSDNPEPWLKMKKQIQDSKFGRAEEMIFTVDLIIYEKKADWPKYIDLAMKYTDKYKLNDFTFLINVSQRFLQQAKEKDQIAKAISWAKKSKEMDPKPYSRETYARLLEKSGDKKAAITELESLISDLKSKDQKTDVYENQLKKWNNQ